MNRAYELGFIIPSNVTEADTDSVIETVKGWIEGFGGAVTDTDKWGRRRLAYPIDDYREGYYVFLSMDMPPEWPQPSPRRQFPAAQASRGGVGSLGLAFCQRPAIMP